MADGADGQRQREGDARSIRANGAMSAARRPRCSTPSQSGHRRGVREGPGWEGGRRRAAQLERTSHSGTRKGGGGGGFIGTGTGGASGQGYVFDRPSKQNRATPDWRAVIIRVARAGRGGAAFFGPKQTQVTAELGIKSGSKSDLAGYSASQDVRPGACQHRDVSSLAGRSAPARKVTQIILSNSAHQPRSLDRRQERTR